MKNIKHFIFTLLFLIFHSHIFGMWGCLKNSEKNQTPPASSSTTKKSTDFNAHFNVALSPAVINFNPAPRSANDRQLHAKQKKLLKQNNALHRQMQGVKEEK